MRPAVRPQTAPPTVAPRAPVDPLTEFDRLSRDLATWASSWGWPDVDEARIPLSDMEETEDAFVVELDLPGVKKGDVEVDLDGRRLQVRASRRERERVGILRHRTRHVGTYHHEVLLPTEVDPDRAEATLDDGVLTVRLPKQDATRRHRIPVG